ncbi:MAG: DedA family protein [Pseudomonadota bacterium]|nr:DedA family protein [Pseudomonadota bacterium]
MASWIEAVVQTTGVLGIAFLMFLENVFPPIPSELIMPLAGYSAAKGDANIVLVILAGTVGSLAGALFWYGLGRLFDHERLKGFADRHGRIITMTRADLTKADDWFDAHGQYAVLFGRLIPTVRTLISIPAGLAEMPIGRFLLYSGIGTAIWTTLLALFGYAVGGRYSELEGWIDPISYGVIALIVAIYVWRVVTFKRH